MFVSKLHPPSTTSVWPRIMSASGEQKMELLDRLGHASSFAEGGPREPL